MWNWSENQINLVMIRHGATKANEEARYLGWTEEDLSLTGKQKLSEYQRQGRYPAVDYVFSSPMKRCLETAELLYPGQPVHIIPEWKEINFGIFEGKNYLELQGSSDYQAWVDSFCMTQIPGGESREMFIRRSYQGFEHMLQQLTQMQMCAGHGERIALTGYPYEVSGHLKDLTIGIIVHGGTIMALCSQLFGGDYFDYQVKNGEVCVYKYHIK